MKTLVQRAIVATAILLCSPRAAEACSVCFGKTNDRLQIGMNFGIFTLLICIGATLAGISGFFVYVAARTRQARARSASHNSPNSPEI